MALVRTTLTAAIGPSDLFWNVANTATGFPVIGATPTGQGQPILVDNEMAFVVTVLSPGLIKVRGRGSDGTAAVAHDVNAPLVTSAVISDFPMNPAGMRIMHPLEFSDQLTLGQTGTVVLPVKDTKYFLASPTAQTVTIGAPSVASNGLQLTWTSATAQAHVLSAALLLNTGAAGSPFSTATFPAQAGASVILEAQNGLWNVIATNGAVVFT